MFTDTLGTAEIILLIMLYHEVMNNNNNNKMHVIYVAIIEVAIYSYYVMGEFR